MELSSMNSSPPPALPRSYVREKSFKVQKYFNFTRPTVADDRKFVT